MGFSAFIVTIIHAFDFHRRKQLYFFFFKYKFIYLFLAALCLHCFAQSSSSCGERGLLFVAVCGLLTAISCLCCGAQALGARASVVAVHGLSCSTACGIIPGRGSNPCTLHWQADSQPLHHQGSPNSNFPFNMMPQSFMQIKTFSVSPPNEKMQSPNRHVSIFGQC